MAIYKLTLDGGEVQATSVVYVEAEREVDARGLVEARGLWVKTAEVVDVSAVPAGVGWQRVPAPARVREVTIHSVARRRTKQVLTGLGLGAVVILAVLFVNRAKEHLLRSDVYPKTPPGQEAATPTP